VGVGLPREGGGSVGGGLARAAPLSPDYSVRNCLDVMSWKTPDARPGDGMGT